MAGIKGPAAPSFDHVPFPSPGCEAQGPETLGLDLRVGKGTEWGLSAWNWSWGSWGTASGRLPEGKGEARGTYVGAEAGLCSRLTSPPLCLLIYRMGRPDAMVRWPQPCNP